MIKRRTKIIATLGPATDREGMLEKLIDAGVDVVRLNFSHGDVEQQRWRVQQTRELASRLGREVAVVADLQGPKIRIEHFADGQITLNAGDAFVLDAESPDRAGDRQRVGVSYPALPDDVSAGDILLLDDGLISLEVTGVQGREVHTRVVNGGELSDRKGLNLQGGGLSVTGLTDEDREHIAIAADLEVDFLAVSFPSSARDMNTARRLLREAGSDAQLIAKIERTEAIQQLESIIDASDAVMVARGDLGVEIGDAELPGIQKRIIGASLAQNRVVATATQMMQSMIEHPIPTRAEVLDVANAVLDGSDAVMLSAETAVGKHPDKAVAAMQRICLGAERHYADSIAPRHLNVRFQRIDQAIAMAAMFTATNVSVQAILALTESGSTAQWLSRVRSSVPIYALTPNPRARRRTAIYRGVYPVAFEPAGETMERVAWEAVQLLFNQGELAAGDRVIVTMGSTVGMEGGTNSMKLLQVGEDGAPAHQSELAYR